MKDNTYTKMYENVKSEVVKLDFTKKYASRRNLTEDKNMKEQINLLENEPLYEVYKNKLFIYKTHKGDELSKDDLKFLVNKLLAENGGGKDFL